MVIERRENGFLAICNMSKRLKIALFIIVPVAVLVAILYCVLGLYVEEEPEVIVFPESGLSASIFDSQNTQYVANESLSTVHECTHIPYTVDTVPSECATIDTGSVYTAGAYYFYYAEVPKEQGMSECIRTQFSKVLKYDADDSSVSIETVKSGTGFTNGFAVEYHVEHLNVPDADTATDAYILAYRLTISDDDEYPDDYDFIIATATTSLTNADLMACKELLDVDVLTVQYNHIMATQMIEDKERADRQAEKEAEKNGTAQSVETPAEASTETPTEDKPFDGTVEEGTIVEDNADEPADGENQEEAYTSDTPTVSSASDNGDAKNMGVLLKKDYEDLTVIINWTNKDCTPSITFTDVNGTTEYQAESCANGSALFHVGAAKAGVYIVKIVNGDQCGTFTSELAGN